MSPRPRLQQPLCVRSALPHVLHVTAELAPLTNITALGEVVGGLTAAQRSIAADVSVVVPRYDGIDPGRWNLAQRVEPLSVPDVGEVTVFEGNLPAGSPRVFLIDHPAFQSESTGGDERGDVLCRAAMSLSRAYRAWPDIVHLHDGLGAPAAALFAEAADANHPAPGVVVTIHRVPIAPRLRDALERADRITAASPRFAASLRTESVAGPLAELVARHASIVRGVFNGVDEHWAPDGDHLLPIRYTADDWSGKAECKEALQAELSLPRRPRVPLIGMVAPLTGDGGGKMLADIGAKLWETEAQFAVLGRGDAKTENALQALSNRLSTRVAVRIGDDPGLAHRITAGADFHLIPGAFEPAAPNQLYCLRYGTVPIVAASNSLADMVVDFDTRTGTGTAIVFDDLASGVRRAVDAYRHPGFPQVIDRAMEIDLSWKTAARHYERAYEKVLRARQARAAS